MLKIEDLEVSYGAVQALRGISMEVNDGEIVSLIGANGAGKTTTLHAITGLVPIKSGSVIYDGHDLRKTDPSRIVTMGLAHVPEGRQVFTRMTVAENLAMGAYFRKDKKAIADDLERVYARFPRLKERAKQLADLVVMQQIACAAGHGDASVFEHIGTVGDGERHLRVLLHEQDRDAQLMHRADDGKHLLHEHG